VTGLTAVVGGMGLLLVDSTEEGLLVRGEEVGPGDVDTVDSLVIVETGRGSVELVVTIGSGVE